MKINRVSYLIIVGLILATLVLNGCIQTDVPLDVVNNNSIKINLTCDDGTIEGECSLDKPYFCSQGKLITKAQTCGCPEKTIKYGTSCSAVCEDGTEYNTCSEDRPFYCSNGSLINNSIKCGCPQSYIKDNNTCIEDLEYDLKLKIIEKEAVESTLNYFISLNNGNIVDVDIVETELIRYGDLNILEQESVKNKYNVDYILDDELIEMEYYDTSWTDYGKIYDLFTNEFKETTNENIFVDKMRFIVIPKITYSNLFKTKEGEYQVSITHKTCKYLYACEEETTFTQVKKIGSKWKIAPYLVFDQTISEICTSNDECFYFFAYKLGNEEYCNKIRESTLKESCYDFNSTIFETINKS